VSGRVLHVSPHPDDEAVGCPVLYRALADSGHHVVNLLTSLGHEKDRARRRGEAQGAADLAGTELVVVEDAVAAPDLASFEDVVVTAVAAEAARGDVLAVLAPSPHDNHPRHEAVGRAVLSALEGTDVALLLYAVWGSLPLPTAVLPCDDTALDGAEALLRCYAGELARNDYIGLVRHRAVAARVLAAEQVFGFGSAQDLAGVGAEVFTEARHRDGRWLAGRPRLLDPASLVAEPSDRDITAWLRGPSARDLVDWSATDRPATDRPAAG
jgi:hypothetical protein